MANSLLSQYCTSHKIDDLAVLALAVDIAGAKGSSLPLSKLLGHSAQWAENIRHCIGSTMDLLAAFIKIHSTVFLIDNQKNVSLKYPIEIKSSDNWMGLIHLCAIIHESSVIKLQTLHEEIDSSPVAIYNFLKPFRQNLTVFLLARTDVFFVDWITQTVQITKSSNKLSSTCNTLQAVCDVIVNNFLRTLSAEYLLVLYLCMMLKLRGSLPLASLTGTLSQAPKVLRYLPQRDEKGQILPFLRQHENLFSISEVGNVTHVTLQCSPAATTVAVATVSNDEDDKKYVRKTVALVYILTIMLENNPISVHQMRTILCSSHEHVISAFKCIGVMCTSVDQLVDFMKTYPHIFEVSLDLSVRLKSTPQPTAGMAYASDLQQLDHDQSKATNLSETSRTASVGKASSSATNQSSVTEANTFQPPQQAGEHAAPEEDALFVKSLQQLCCDALAIDYLFWCLERRNNHATIKDLVSIVNSVPTYVKSAAHFTPDGLKDFFFRYNIFFTYDYACEAVTCVNSDAWLPYNKVTHSVRFLASLLHIKGAVSVKQLTGTLGSASKTTRKCIGILITDIDAFIKKHSSYFFYNSDLVQINEKALWQVFVQFFPASIVVRQKANFIDLYGQVIKLQRRKGNLSVFNMPDTIIMFHITDCLLEYTDDMYKGLKLVDFISVGDQVVFDMVLTKDGAYQALRVRKDLPCNAHEVSNVCSFKFKLLETAEKVQCSSDMGRVAIENVPHGNTNENSLNSVSNYMASLSLSDIVNMSLDCKLQSVRVSDNVVQNDIQCVADTMQTPSRHNSSISVTQEKIENSHSESVLQQDNELRAHCLELLVFETVIIVLCKHNCKLNMQKMLTCLHQWPLANVHLKTAMPSIVECRLFVKKYPQYFAYNSVQDEAELYKQPYGSNMAQFVIYVIKVMASLLLVFGFKSPVSFCGRLGNCSQKVRDWIGIDGGKVMTFFKENNNYFTINGSTVSVNKTNLFELFDESKVKQVELNLLGSLAGYSIAGQHASRNSESATTLSFIDTSLSTINEQKVLIHADKTTDETSSVQPTDFCGNVKEQPSTMVTYNDSVSCSETKCTAVSYASAVRAMVNTHLLDSGKQADGMQADRSSETSYEEDADESDDGNEEVIDMLKVLITNAANKTLGSIVLAVSADQVLSHVIGTTDGELLNFIGRHRSHFRYSRQRNVMFSIDSSLFSEEKKIKYTVGFVKSFIRRIGGTSIKSLRGRAQTASEIVQTTMGTGKRAIITFVHNNSDTFVVSQGTIGLLEKQVQHSLSSDELQYARCSISEASFGSQSDADSDCLRRGSVVGFKVESSTVRGKVAEVLHDCCLTVTVAESRIKFNIGALLLKHRCSCGDLRNHIIVGSTVFMHLLRVSVDGELFAEEACLVDSVNRKQLDYTIISQDYSENSKDIKTAAFHYHSVHAIETDKIFSGHGVVCMHHNSLICVAFSKDKHGLFESPLSLAMPRDTFQLNSHVGFIAEKCMSYSTEWKIRSIWPFQECL